MQLGLKTVAKAFLLQREKAKSQMQLVMGRSMEEMMGMLP